MARLLRSGVMMLVRMVLLMLLLWPAVARADVFARMTGQFGSLDGVNTCRDNPHMIRFSADRTRAFFVWQAPIWSYRDEWATAAAYTVISHDDAGITMALDDETRLTAAGAPVVWVARPTQDPEGYCWGRTDWPLADCGFTQIRCGAPALS